MLKKACGHNDRGDRIDPEPGVQISRTSRCTLGGEGLPTNDQESNLMIEQQSGKLAEVSIHLHRSLN